MIACFFVVILFSHLCQAPRMEAQTILGSLVCFPNLYLQIPVLQRVPGSDDFIASNEDIKVNGQRVPYWIYAVMTFKNCSQKCGLVSCSMKNIHILVIIKRVLHISPKMRTS